MKVAILGASNNPSRYAHMAFKMLRDYHHEVFPVNPALPEIEGVKVAAGLGELAPGSVDTLTMYVGAARSTPLTGEILALQPKRVIFNPGSENPGLEAQLKSAGIEVVEGCTLVMLRTSQF